MWLDSCNLDIVPTGSPAGLAMRMQGKKGHLSGFCSKQIVVLLLKWGRDWFGMGNQEFSFRHVRHIRTQMAPSVGN